jgi:hypothetical protein
MARWQCGAPEPDPPPRTKKEPYRNKALDSEADATTRLDRLIEDQVFEKDVPGAIRLGAFSSEGLCSPSSEFFAKHPASSEAMVFPEAPLLPNLVVNPK